MLRFLFKHLSSQSGILFVSLALVAASPEAKEDPGTNPKNDPQGSWASAREISPLAAQEDRFTEKEIEYFTREAKVPPHLQSEAPPSSPGGVKILFRRQSANVRITCLMAATKKTPKRLSAG